MPLTRSHVPNSLVTMPCEKAEDTYSEVGAHRRLSAGVEASSGFPGIKLFPKSHRQPLIPENRPFLDEMEIEALPKTDLR